MTTLSEYNRRLAEVRSRMTDKCKIENAVREAKEREDEAQARVKELARILDAEREDVERINGGLRSIYYSMIGRKQEKLETEQAEADAAEAGYEAARGALAQIHERVEQLKQAQRLMMNAEREYERLLSQKEEAMRAESRYAQTIARIEEERKALDGQLREIEEAARVGRRAESQIDQIDEALESADGYATWDLLGGGFIADSMKHERLDTAQEGLERLKALLVQFRAELADVSGLNDVQAQVSGGVRFFDYLFDGFFVDFAVKRHIEKVSESMRQTRGELRRAMTELSRAESELRRRRSSNEDELRRLVEEAE